MKKILLIPIIIMLFNSCDREEGRGGTSTIKGHVTVWEYNKDYSIKLGEYPAQEIDVFILYGGNDIHGDRFRTGHDGQYEFKYLTEGKYTVYALSKDTNNVLTNERYPVFQEVNITGKNQVVEAPEIIIVD